LYPRWRSIFLCLGSFFELVCRAPEPAQRVAMVEASRVYRRMLLPLDDSGLMGPATEIAGPDAWHIFLAWADELTRRLAAGDDTAFN